MSSRLLLVEPSATMRYVLEKHARSLGFRVEAVDDYSAAADALTRQYQQFGDEYAGLLFGWPPVHNTAAGNLALQLEQSEFRDLPVLVMSTDMRAETRAWVSARPSTALLAWKNYRQLDPLLQRLLRQLPEGEERLPTPTDNSDVTMMVVDDSATIRLSLSELFQKQGYKVLLASNEEEALKIAADTLIDIAVVDYYLGETTGDTLCQLLLADRNQPNILCTVLTGTYADHIIRRSLRAGAIECMFKNESSELLLGRIDALSRFVRERRRGEKERRLMQGALETYTGAFVLLDSEGMISHLSDTARSLLSLDEDARLEGQPAEVLFPIKAIDNPESGVWQVSDWRQPDGGLVQLGWQLSNADENLRLFLLRNADSDLGGESETTAPTTPAEQAASSEDAVSDTANRITAAGNTLAGVATASHPVAKTPASELSRSQQEVGSRAVRQPRELLGLFKLDEECLPLLQCAQSYLDDINEIDERLSLLFIDVFMIDDLDRPRSVEQVLRLEPLVRRSLHAMYQRAHHVAGLRGNRYGFILRHREESQAYLLTRKIMQLTNRIRLHDDGPQLASTASLISLSSNADKSLESMLTLGFRALDVVNAKGVNQALLIDLRRMLSVYPPEEIR